jgi:secondary thiamine-phosphate synthase enzyme
LAKINRILSILPGDNAAIEFSNLVTGFYNEGKIVRDIITISTNQREQLIDITKQVKRVLEKSGVRDGLVNVYAQGATAGIMIQENWDDSVQTDVVHLLQKLIPKGVWLHDKQDGNGDSHLKSGLVGPSETIPLMGGQLGLSTWQNIFFCEFDGPRDERKIQVTIIADNAT